MSDIEMIAGALSVEHAGRTIKFTTPSGFHEYYELVAVAHDHLKVLITVRARKLDSRFMVAVLSFEQPVVVSDYSNDVGEARPKYLDWQE